MANANIFQQWLQAPRSIADYSAEMDRQDANALSLVAQRRQNEMAGLQAEQTRAGMADAAKKRNAIEAVYAQLGPNADPLSRARALQSNPMTAAEGVAAEKAILENQKTAAGTSKDMAETDAKKLDASIKAHEFHVQLLGSVSTPQDAMAWAQQGLQSGVFTPEQYQRGMQGMQQALSQPGGLEKWKQMALRGGQSATEQLRQQLAEKAQAETGRHNMATETNAAGQLRVSQGQLGVAQGNLGLSRERLTLEKNQPKGQYDAERGVLVDPRTGQATPVTMGGQPLNPKKPSDQTQKVTDANDVLSLLKQAEPLIKSSTGSYAGTAIDEGARAVGISTPGAQSAAKLKALEGTLISKMPKMSGPQSDKDVLLYKQMAGQIGDPTIPAATKRAAMETIREIAQRNAGVQPDQAAPDGVPSDIADLLKKHGGRK